MGNEGECLKLYIFRKEIPLSLLRPCAQICNFTLIVGVVDECIS